MELLLPKHIALYVAYLVVYALMWPVFPFPNYRKLQAPQEEVA